MRATFFCLVNLLLCRLLLAASDPASLAAELRRIEAQIDQGQGASVRKALPKEWVVSTPEGSYTISTEPLQDLLKSNLGNERENQQEAHAWLDHLAAHLEQSSSVSRVDADADGEIARILARPEFRGIGPPSQWDLIRGRIQVWFANLLGRVFSFVQQHSSESKVFFWVVMIAAVVTIGAWLLRRSTRQERLSLGIASPAVPARTSNEWIVAARSASERGDFRQAIQCAYWAAIVRLEDMGSLPRNQPHTPRECLRMISERRKGEPSQFAAPLSALTAGLERHWYADKTARAEDVSACFGALEALGCRLD